MFLSVHRGFMDMFQHLLLTLLLLHQATCTCKRAEVTGAVGRSVTFCLSSMNETTAWSFHNELIVTVRFGNPPEATFFDNNYKSRLAFPKNGSALSISQLRMDDAGTYTAKTTREKITFTLHVYRELAVPKVTCVAQNCSADGCNYTLHCTASGPGSGNVSYGWSMGSMLLSEGPVVVVEKSPLDKLLLICMAQNPVSSRNATVISPAALCAENTTHSPTTGELPNRLSVSGVCLSWSVFNLPAAWATNTEDGADNMTVYAQVGPYQQVHLQSFSNAQQDDPNKTPSTDGETSKTIYFTVQATAQTDDEKMGNGVPGCWQQDEKHHYTSVS
ncbi:SLAM family member 5-like [Pluvialis apricaria]